MHTAPNIQLRGRPLDRHWREARKRRTQSEDFGGLEIKPDSPINSMNSGLETKGDGDLVKTTLEQIRAQNSRDKTRMSCEEIDCLLNNIRRSRSQSSTRPPPPSTSPPVPPSDPISTVTLDSLPFGVMGLKIKKKTIKAKPRPAARGSTWAEKSVSSNNDDIDKSQKEVQEPKWTHNPLYHSESPKPYPRRNSHADQVKAANNKVEDIGVQLASLKDELKVVKETANRIKSEVDEFHPRRAKSPPLFSIRPAVTIEEMDAMDEHFAQYHKTHLIRPPPRKNKAAKNRGASRSCSSSKDDFNHRQISMSPPSKTSKQQMKSLADQKKDQGNERYKTKNYREALQLYSEAITLDPECPAYYSNRSACYMMLAQFNDGLKDAKTCVELDSDFTKGYIRMIKCCVALGEVASAKQALQRALEIEPDNAGLKSEKNSVDSLEKFKNEAQSAFNDKEYRKALYCLDRALTIATACRNLKILRAECLAFLGRIPEGQEVANDLLRADGRNADAMYVRGLCLYYEDNLDKAFSHFQQVLRLAPDHRAKHVYKKAKLLKQKKDEGNAAFKASKLSEALSLYSEALEIDPLNKTTNAKLFFNRGTVAARMSKWQQSVDDCTAALNLDDGYLKALLRRAKSLIELESYEEAVRDCEKAVRLDRSVETKRLLQQAKLELQKSKRKDYYKILGVSKTASDDEIKKAYRKRAMVHHPDRHANATEEEKKEHEKKFKEVGEAYGVLTDSKKRTRYDNGHDLDNLDGGHGFSGHGVDPSDIFQAFFHGGAGAPNMGGGMPGGTHFSFGGMGGGGGGAAPGGFSFQFG
ncbi:dnaJ homolog subfamily C member 7-like isoform X2 [Tigriopus californicus]|uniref:dnaJ homolog subfamily C member 7-like isoform X2 n=1 Tax=Tigriopus californicus TaxID=6832 RepID=UPI0027DAAF41|nr:dnaJ homolog subfamily C member 7-like isoform X2 [Tigriopus californicus]